MVQTAEQSGWEVLSLERRSQTEKKEEQKNRTEKLTELFSSYSDEILRICFLYLKDYQLAEDAVQETYLRAYRHYGSFMGKSSPKTWLIRIAINVCKTMLSRNQRGEIAYEDVAFEKDRMESGELTETDALVERTVVSKAVMSLKKEFREVIILYYYQEFKLREIADILSIPLTTAIYRQQKGKKQLKQILEKEEKGGLGL